MFSEDEWIIRRRVFYHSRPLAFRSSTGYNASMLAVLALTALLAASARAQPPLVEVVSKRVIDPASFIPVTPAGAASVPLALVVEDRSRWDAPGELEAVLGKASAILGRCGVTLGAAEVMTVRWSADVLGRMNHEDPYAAPVQSFILAEPRFPARRPIGFLFERSIPSTAKAYNKESTDVFAARFPEAKNILDTFWITIDQLHRPLRTDEQASYSVFAHELVHILGNLPHTRAAPNLMTEAQSPGAKSGDLNDAQCVEIRKLF